MNKPEIKAVYRQRMDGDWDFVAAFSTESFPDPLSQADANSVDAMCQMLVEAINSEHDQAKVVEFDEPDMPSVLDGEKEST